MTILLDTNILVRLVNPGDAHHETVINALDVACHRGYRPSLVPQVLYEFWVVATRPAEQNGLAMDVSQAEPDVAKSLDKFYLLRDERVVFDHWHRLVTEMAVEGKQAHDARIVAAMLRHNIRHLLTLNTADFARYPSILATAPANAGTLPKWA